MVESWIKKTFTPMKTCLFILLCLAVIFGLRELTWLGGISFTLEPFIHLIIWRFYGLTWGLVSVVTSSLFEVNSYDLIFELVLYCLQLLFLQLLFSRKILKSFLYSVLLYWLVPGTLLGMLFYGFSLGFERNMLALVLTNQFLTSFFNAVLASLFSIYIPRSMVKKKRLNAYLSSLRNTVLILIVFSAITPYTIILSLEKSKDMNEKQELISSRLQQAIKEYYTGNSVNDSPSTDKVNKEAMENIKVSILSKTQQQTVVPYYFSREKQLQALTPKTNYTLFKTHQLNNEEKTFQATYKKEQIKKIIYKHFDSIIRMSLDVYILVFFIAMILSYLIIKPINKFIKITSDLTESLTSKRNNQLNASIPEEQLIYHNANRIKRTVNQLTEKVKQTEDSLKFFDEFDPLTGLYNLRYFTNTLDKLCNDKKNSSFTVILIGLDRFKIFNETLGQEAGDRVLIEIGTNRLQPFMEGKGIVARKNSDEFLILIPHCSDRYELMQLVKELNQSINQPIVIDNYQHTITASVGVVLYPNDGHTAEELIKGSTIALSYVKENGKNSFGFYHIDIEQAMKEKLEIEEKLRKALVHNEFTLNYQPQYDVQKQEISGVEALVRWYNSDLGFVSPGRFIPIAEETNLIKEIGTWVLYEACRQLQVWNSQMTSPIKVSVNISMKQFLDDHFVDNVKDALKNYQVKPEQLELEITESIAISDKNKVISRLLALKDLGILIALDDFGTGYSSLSYLEMLPIQVLKIDKSFVDKIFDTKNSKKIINAIIQLARAFDMRVVAEGVETVEQLRYLEENSCTIIQGYLYKRPLPPDQLTELLINRDKQVFQIT